ncbi:hypothetical protein YC2023_008076 [Brassica napus]
MPITRKNYEEIYSSEESLLQEEVCITEVEVSEQQTDDILLIDVNNRQYEDLFDYMTDEESEEEFDASDDNHCTDIKKYDKGDDVVKGYGVNR